MRSSLFVRQANASFPYPIVLLSLAWMTPLARAEEGVVQLRGYGPQVSRLAVSPDGILLAVATEGRTPAIDLYDLKTHRKVRSLSGPDDSFSALNFSPDGKLLAVADRRGSAQLWRVGSWDTPIHIPYALAGFSALAFSPDGKWLVLCGSKPLRDRPQPNLLVWDVKARTSREVVVPGQPLSGVVFLPDGKEMITSGEDGLLRFWDPGTLEQTRTFKASEAITGLALSPDGKWLALSSSPFFELPFAVYDVERRKVGWTEKRLGRSTGMAFSPDSKLLVHGSGNWTSVWEADTGIFYRQFQTPRYHASRVVAFTPEGKLLTASAGGILIWDPKVLKPLPRP